MTYAYLRVSTVGQTVENQRYELEAFCVQHYIHIDHWIEECASGAKDYRRRALGKLLETVGAGDLIICTELSRLGRSLFMIMELLSVCMQRGCQVWTLKDGYRLGDDVTSKVLAFAFGLSAEIERKLIAQRTKEALARLKQEGRTLGRPLGRLSQRTKLTGYEEEIRLALQEKRSLTSLASSFGVSVPTLRRFIRRHSLAPS